MSKQNIGVIVGSLRKDSFSKKLAQELIAFAPKDLSCSIIEIGDLPLYNEDLDKGEAPAAWTRFRDEISKSKGVLFVTPEYNRSMPGCLKNAIDVGSRPYGKSVWSGQPTAVVSDSPSKIGGFGSNHALRQTFVFLDMLVMQQPEAYIGSVSELLGKDGKITNEDTKKFLTQFMGSFEEWVDRIHNSSSGHPEFEEFIEKRKKIASDYTNGDFAALNEIITQKNPATFFSPGGDMEDGVKAVTASYKKGAESFQKGGKSSLEIMQAKASGDLAFWTGVQHADVKMAKSGEVVPMTIRITEVFRFEDGAFKLVHRHADSPSKSK